ncbi:MAG: hypothetical protein V3S55_10485 [Nitrospiraceae bacterium]
MNRKKWPTAFPPLLDLADLDAYAKALECHLLGYSEYLAALIYDREGQIPRELSHIPVKLVEDLKIRIDQTIVECVARMKAQNEDLQKTIEAYYPRRDD